MDILSFRLVLQLTHSMWLYNILLYIGFNLLKLYFKQIGFCVGKVYLKDLLDLFQTNNMCIHSGLCTVCLMKHPNATSGHYSSYIHQELASVVLCNKPLWGFSNEISYSI